VACDVAPPPLIHVRQVVTPAQLLKVSRMVMEATLSFQAFEALPVDEKRVFTVDSAAAQHRR
jgi:hypothetical protein